MKHVHPSIYHCRCATDFYCRVHPVRRRYRRLSVTLYVAGLALAALSMIWFGCSNGPLVDVNEIKANQCIAAKMTPRLRDGRITCVINPLDP